MIMPYYSFILPNLPLFNTYAFVLINYFSTLDHLLAQLISNNCLYLTFLLLNKVGMLQKKFTRQIKTNTTLNQYV
jgi:hypothetical protein